MADSEKAVIGGDENVGRVFQPLFLQGLAQLAQHGVGIAGARLARRSVDARLIFAQAVAGAVLAHVGIARPEQHGEGFAAFLEVRQHDAGGGLHQPHFLRNVGHLRRRCAGADKGRLHLAGEPGGQGEAAFMAGIVVQDQCLAAVGRSGGIGNARRSQLADHRGGKALRAGAGEQRVLVQVIAAEFLVHLGQHRVVLQRRDGRAIGADHGHAGINGIAEIAGVADVMAGGDGAGIDRGDGGKQRMAVGEIHPFALQLEHVGHVARLDAAIAQPVGHEDDDVVRPGAWRQAGSRPAGQAGQRRMRSSWAIPHNGPR